MPRDKQMAESIHRGYEPRDVSVRGLVWFTVVLVIAVVVIHVVTGWVYLEFRPPPESIFPAENPDVNWERVPRPHLETAPERTAK